MSENYQRRRRVWIYPERPAAVVRQLAADLFAGGWVYLWIRAAAWLHGLVDMLALRALARQAVTRLARANSDVAAGWRQGDPATLDALAALELRRAGLRPAPARPEPFPYPAIPADDLPTPADPWAAG